MMLFAALGSALSSACICSGGMLGAATSPPGAFTGVGVLLSHDGVGKLMLGMDAPGLLKSVYKVYYMSRYDSIPSRWGRAALC